MSETNEKLKNYFYSHFPTITVQNRNLLIDLARRPENYTPDMQRSFWQNFRGVNAEGAAATFEQLEPILKDLRELLSDDEDIVNVSEPPEPPNEEVFTGLVGEFVDLWSPHSEADRIALAIQFIVAIGNAVGRGPFFAVSGTDHHTNLQACLVGSTSFGSKGSAYDCIKHTFDRISDFQLNTKSGLSTGEGLINLVRDPAYGVDKKGKQVLTHQGVADKRLLVVEPEFASVLRRGKREGNTLSAVLRQAADGSALGTLTKGDPLRATDPHISVIYHITPTELASQLDHDSTMNGFANRIMFIYSQRSKSLPNPGRPSEAAFKAFIPKLARAIEFARGNPMPFGNEEEKAKAIPGVREMKRSTAADILWETVYEQITQPRNGRQHNAVCARARVHVLRLSMIYALLDGKSERVEKQSHEAQALKHADDHDVTCDCTVKRQHVRSAYYLWEYAERTSRYVFGDSLGDRFAEKVLEIIRGAGADGILTRDIVHKVSQKGKVTDALSLLLENQQVRVKDLKDSKSHRGQRWFIK